MRHPRARSKSLHLLLVTFLILDPFLRAAPAHASNFSAPHSMASAVGGASRGGVAVNPSTGDATYAIPISVPPGTAGMQPNLALVYNSGSREGSWAGLGWSAPVSSIKRSLRNGVPSYDPAYDGTGDMFELDGQALVYQNTTGVEAVYNTKRQSFLDVRHNNTTDIWKVTRPDGHRMYFGQSASSKVGVGPVTFEWLVTCEEDAIGTPCVSGTSGNKINYTYYKDISNFVVYLQEVAYGLDPKRFVRFELETADRPDQPVSYLAGFGLAQKLTRRLDHITVQTVTGVNPAPANIIRRYDLEFADASGGQSIDSTRSLLRAVTLKGVGAAGGLTTNFTYKQNTTGATGWDPTAIPWTGAAAGNHAEINGDGLADTFSDHTFCLNTGAAYTCTHNYSVPTFSGAAPLVDFTDSLGDATGTQLVDLNRDGRADVVSRRLYLTNGQFTFEGQPGWISSGVNPATGAVAWNNAVGVITDSHLSFAQVAAVSPALPGSGVFADLNGDGAPEVVVRGDTAIWLTTASCSERRRSEYVYWNNGGMSFSPGSFTDTATPAGECAGLGTRRQGAEYSVLGGFDPPVTKMALSPTVNTPPVYYASVDDRSLIEYADLNGDGLADAVWTQVVPGSPPTYIRHAYLNGGGGAFSSADDWRPPVDFFHAPGSVPFPNGVRLVDVNGDGQLDVVHARAGAPRQTWLGKGSTDGAPETAFVLAPSWVLPVDLVSAFGSGVGVTPVALVDVNGDTLPDLSFAGSVRLNIGSIPDLLTAVETPYGAKTNITWTTSGSAIDATISPFPNSNASAVGFMPSLKPVVKAVEIDALSGVRGRSEYAYVRGVFDTVEREFLGFEKVTQTVGTAITVSGNPVFTPEYRVETTFKNNSYSQAGLALETLVSDAEGAAYYPRRRTIITYGAGTATRLPVRVLEKRSEQASATPTVFQRACTQFIYDAITGIPTQIDQLGLVTNDTCTDDVADTIRSTTLTYAGGSAITGAPSRITQRAIAAPSGAVTVLRDTKLYYDSLALGSIGAGLLTRQERLQATNPLDDNPTVLAATTFAYDTATGRLQSSTNPRANSGEIAPAAKGTRYVDYDASYPDFVGQTRSEPFYASQRLTTTTSFVTDTACAVNMPALAGMPAVVTDANGFETVLCYDVYGRPTARIEFGGTTELARTTFAYDDTKATATTNPSATTTEYLDANNTRTVTATLDAHGRTTLTSASGPGGMTIKRSVAYDGLGRVSIVSQPGDGTPGTFAAQYFYDGLGREVLRQSPHPTSGIVSWTTAYTIDADRLRADSTDPEAHQNRSFADAFGDVVQVDEMTGTTPTSTTYKYDATGSLTEIKDVNGNTSSFFYDSLGRRASMIDPDTGLWSHTYDANGNLKAQNGPRTPTPPATLDPDLLQWTYDFLDRPKTMTRVAVGTTPPTNTTKTWTYDFATNGLGRFEVESEAGEGFRVVSYDGLGRPVAERAVAAGKQFDFQTAYNRAGDVLSRSYPTGRTINYSRDSKGFVTGVTTGAGGTEIYASGVSWHQSLQLSAWTAGNGVVTTYGYDASTMLPSSFNAGGVENISSYTFKNNYRLASTAGTTNSSFTYDARDRLTKATGPYTTGYAPTDLFYGYDAIGNLTCMDASQAPSGTTCENGKLFTYPTTPQPVLPHAPTAISGMSAPSYDAAGNMLTGNGNTYTYDAEGHVASINGTTLTANYAGDGNAWKITTGAGALSRYRIYDDFEWTTANLARTSVFLGGKIIAITQEDFTPATSGGCGQVWPRNTPQPAGGELALLLMYAFAGALALPMARAIRRNRPRTLRGWASVGTSAVFLVFVSVPPQLVPEEAEAAAPINTAFFHPDRLGSSLVVSNNTGAASAKRVVYRPFGALVQESSAGTSTVPERGFTGQRFEASVGVYDYGARWYDPGIARFVQPDPLIQDATNPQQLNPFSYVNGDPSNFADPSGLEEVGIEEIIIIGHRTQIDWGSTGSHGGSSSGVGVEGIPGGPGSGGFPAPVLRLDPAYTNLRFNFYTPGSSKDPNRSSQASNDAPDAQHGTPNPYDPATKPLAHQLWENFPSLRVAIEEAMKHPGRSIGIKDWMKIPGLATTLEELGFWSIRTTGAHDIDLRFENVHLTYDRVGGRVQPYLHYDRFDPASGFYNLWRHFWFDVVKIPFGN